MLRKIFCVKIGQNGYQNAQNFILIPNLKTKLKKRATIESFILNYKKTVSLSYLVFCTCSVFFSVLSSDLESA